MHVDIGSFDLKWNLGKWILDSSFSRILDSKSWILIPSIQDSEAKISWIPESGLPYMGRLLRHSELRTRLQHPCAVLAERERTVIW